MNGNIEYEKPIERRINGLLERNEELVGFYAFIGDKSPTTTYNYLLFINNFLNYCKKQPEELTIDDFSKYLMFSQIKEDGTKITSSRKIVNYHALKKYGKYLVASGRLEKNPMDSIDRPKAVDSQETIQKREIGYLDKKEISNYINSVKNGAGTDRSVARQEKWKERDLAIIMIFLNTGIRCSALMKLDVNSIDFENKILIVTEKESKVKVCELSDELLDIIKIWLDKREQLLAGVVTEALFISNRKKRMEQHSITKVVKKYACNIEGKNITPHKLRATYGTQLYEATKDIYFVQQCMGHNNPKTTEMYIRGNKNQTKRASDIMKNLTMNEL